MKGVVFNLFEKFVTESFGEDAYEDILDDSELETKEPFVGPGTYPDGDMMSMVATASKQLNIPIEDAVKAFGKFMFGQLAAMTPQFVEPFSHPKDFLMTVEEVIHVEVRKLYQQAETPQFEYEDLGPNKLKIIYNSKRKMFKLMEGLIEGVGDYFGYQINQTFAEDGDLGVFTLEFKKN